MIVGGADSAVAKALFAANLAKTVIVIVRSNEFHVKKDQLKLETLLKHPKIHVLYNRQVKSFEGKNRQLTHVCLDNGECLRCDAAFVAIGSYPNISAFPQLELEDGGLKVDCKTQQTSCPGVFAAGDVCDRIFTQAITAAGAAARASWNALKFLQEKSVDQLRKSSSMDLKQILQSTQLTAVVVASNSCVNCQMEMDKIQSFMQAATRLKVPFLYIDIDQDWNEQLQQFLDQLKINDYTLPVLMLIRNGKLHSIFPNNSVLQNVN